MPFRPCPSGCGRFLSADDGHDRCLQCLGRQHAEAAFVDDSCVCCGRMSMISLRSRLSFMKGLAPSAATRADLSGSSRGSPADALGDLRVTVRASPPGTPPRTSYSSRSEHPVRFPGDFAGLSHGAPSISFGAPSVDRMSIAASGDGFTSSEDEGAVGLPPSGVVATATPDPELTAMLARAAVSIGLEVNRPPSPEPSRLDDWFIGAGRGSQPRPAPVPFFPEVHEELTSSWMAPFTARSRSSASSVLTTLDGGVARWRERSRCTCAHETPPLGGTVRVSRQRPVSWQPLSRPKLTVLRARQPPPCTPWLSCRFTKPRRSNRCTRVVPTRGWCRSCARRLTSLYERRKSRRGPSGRRCPPWWSRSAISGSTWQRWRTSTRHAFSTPPSPREGCSATPSRASPSSSRRYSSRPRRSSTSCSGVMHHPPLPPGPGLSLPVAVGALLRPPEPLRPRPNRHIGRCVEPLAGERRPPRPSQAPSRPGSRRSGPDAGNPEMLEFALSQETARTAPLLPPVEGREENLLFRFVSVPPLVQGPAVPTFSKKEQFPFPPGSQVHGTTVYDALPPHSRPRPILPVAKRVRFGDDIPPHAPLASPVRDPGSSVRMPQNAPPSVPSTPTPFRCTTTGTSIVPLEPLARRLEAWLTLPSLSRWLTRTIRLSYAIQFARRPPKFNGFLETSVAVRNAPVLREEIAVLLAKDAIEPVPPAEMRQGFYSPYFIIPKKGGGLRPILDLRVLNRALHKLPFKMLTHRRMIKCIQPQDWFAAIDLKDVYFHVSILPRHRPFLRFAFEGRAWQYRVLPFGLSLSPRVFTKVKTLKTALLTALTSIKRVGDLQAFSGSEECLVFGPVYSHVVLRPRPGYVPKVPTTPFRDQVVNLQALPSEEADPALALLCPVRALRIYVTRTRSVRSSEQLFVCHGGQQKGKAVSKQRLAHWIVEAVALAYQSQGEPCPLGVRAHSTRSVASSHALAHGASLADICRAAGWATPNTFARFYNLRVEPVSSVYWVSNGREELAGVTLAAPFPLTRGYERLFLPQFSSPDGEPWWNPPSTPGSQTGRSSLTPGPVLVLARPGLRSAPVLG